MHSSSQVAKLCCPQAACLHSSTVASVPVSDSYVERGSLLVARPIEAVCDGIRRARGDVTQPHAGCQHGPVAFIRPGVT